MLGLQRLFIGVVNQQRFKMLSAFRISALLIGTIITLSVSAQTPGKQVTHQQLIWYTYLNTLEFNSKWFLTSEIHERRFINPDKQHQFALRSHLHYVLGRNWDASIGFTYFLQSPHDPNATSNLVVPELRPHIQANYKQPLGKFAILHRYMLEKRFFRNVANDELIQGYTSNYRFRYQLGVEYQLLTIKNNPLKLKVSDELHVNAGKRITYNRFDQNRLYLGLNYAVLKNLTVETGYLHWYQQRASGHEFYNRNIIRLTINHKIDLQRLKGHEAEGT